MLGSRKSRHSPELCLHLYEIHNFTSAVLLRTDIMGCIPWGKGTQWGKNVPFVKTVSLVIRETGLCIYARGRVWGGGCRGSVSQRSLKRNFKNSLHEMKMIIKLTNLWVQQSIVYLEGSLKGILASALLFLGSLALVEASHHVVRTLKQPLGETPVPQNWGTSAKSQH